MKTYSKEEWNNHINNIIKDKKMIDDKDKVKNEIKNNLVKNINNIKEKYGILFSGGIDSTLLALISKKLNKDFICYTIGVSGSKDLDLVMDIAKGYGFNIKMKIINVNDVKNIIKNVIDIINNKNINNINVINVGVGCVVYSGMLLAKENKIKTVITGMGADELFAGYKEFLSVKDVNEHCVYRLKNIYGDLNRDVNIGKKLKIKLVTPYLNDDIIKIATQTPPKFKISKGVRKLILRELGVEIGLDRKYAFIEKRAAQYSSGFDKAISKLAKKQGFGNKRDYLRSLSVRPHLVTKT